MPLTLSAVKTLFVILLSTLLSGAQSVFTAESLCPTAHARASCACCHCDTPSCCAAKSNPVSPSPAAPPARDNSQSPFQLLAAQLTSTLSLPAPASSESVSS